MPERHDPSFRDERTFMAAKFLLMLGLSFVVSFSTQAQNRADLFGGYSYTRFRNSPSANLNGWEIAGKYKFADWLGAAADFDGHYGSPDGVGTSTYTYLFGPQISWPARVSPFTHLLLGGAHISAAGFGNSSFSMALGAGIDAKMIDGFYWRVIQSDYLMTHFGRTQNNLRLSTGIIFRF
jgi:hypothetical protein